MGTLGGSLANNDPAADYPAAVLGLRRDGAHERSARSPPTISSRACSRRRWHPTRSSPPSSFRCAQRAAYAKFPQSGVALRAGRRVRRAGGEWRRARRRDRRGAVGVPRDGDRGRAAARASRPTRRRACAVDASGLNSDLHGSRRVPRASRLGHGVAGGRGLRLRHDRRIGAARRQRSFSDACAGTQVASRARRSRRIGAATGLGPASPRSAERAPAHLPHLRRRTLALLEQQTTSPTAGSPPRSSSR